MRHLFFGEMHVFSDLRCIIRVEKSQKCELSQSFQGISDFVHDLESKLPCDRALFGLSKRLSDKR
jgi:hypothetical protein